MGSLQQRLAVRTVLCHLRDRSPTIDLLSGKNAEGADIHRKTPHHSLLVFFGIVLITAAVELLGSYIMEFATGGWMWDHRKYAFNFQGRIALNPGIRFGIGGMFFLYVLQPPFIKLVEKMPAKISSVITGILAALFFADMIVTFILPVLH